MPDILLNSSTEKQLRSFLASPSQGLLLQGASGSGKTTILEWAAAKLLGVDLPKLAAYPYLLKLLPDEKGLISIAAVRQIDHFISRAIPGNSERITRLILIDDAECLSLDAQNALLKNLEEPPANSAFLLASANPTKLLPTVRSRLTLIRIVNPARSALADYLKAQGASTDQAKRAISMSGGSIGMATAIALRDQNHPFASATETARQILSTDAYGRLLLVNKLQKEPDLARNALIVLEQMARIALETSSGAQAERWQRILASSYQAKRELEKNTNLRLTLTHLMLHL